MVVSLWIAVVSETTMTTSDAMMVVSLWIAVVSETTMTTSLPTMTRSLAIVVVCRWIAVVSLTTMTTSEAAMTRSLAIWVVSLLTIVMSESIAVALISIAATSLEIVTSEPVKPAAVRLSILSPVAPALIAPRVVKTWSRAVLARFPSIMYWSTAAPREKVPCVASVSSVPFQAVVAAEPSPLAS